MAEDVRRLPEKFCFIVERRAEPFGVGAGVNSNGGLGGNITYEQRNFDIGDCEPFRDDAVTPEWEVPDVSGDGLPIESVTSGHSIERIDPTVHLIHGEFDSVVPSVESIRARIDELVGF